MGGPSEEDGRGRHVRGCRGQAAAGREGQDAASPHAHLDLLLQVFSSSHEVLNLPGENTSMGVWAGGAFKLLSSSCSMLSRTLHPTQTRPPELFIRSLLQEAFPTKAAPPCLSPCPDPRHLSP